MKSLRIKSLKKLSRLYEITIRPTESNTYFRLVLVIYLLSISLIVYSSLYLIIKLILIALIIILLRFDWINKSPDNGINEIQFIHNEWILFLNNGKNQRYSGAQVLVHNILFQLIQFTHLNQKRHIVLFHDQISKSQWRLLHLKIAQK